MQHARCFGMVLLAAVFLAARPATSAGGAADGRLDVYWVDVEGGAATLVVTPAGQSVLIDTGNPGRRDAGRIFQVAAKEAGLRRIDFLIVTHYHRDHFGGAADLAELMPIGAVYDNGEFEGGIERPDADYLRFKADERLVINPGDRLPLVQAPQRQAELELLCLGTRQQFVEPPAGAAGNEAICAEHKPKDRDGSDNANSVVLLLSMGKFRFFDAGDLTWNVEHKLVCPVNLVGEVDVYQATHHGLDASNNPLVVRSLKPAVAVINNGPVKGCESGTFATLRDASSIEAIYQLHRNLRPDSENNTAEQYIANAQEQCEAHHIKMSVDPSGLTYTLSIPANGHVRQFQVKAGR